MNGLRQGSKLFLVLLLVITVIGGAARFYKLGEKSLWSDEIATIATSLGNSIDPEAFRLRGEAFDPPAPVQASVYAGEATHSHGAGNFGRTAEVLKANVHPPLFFWLMNLWIHAFGHEPGPLRIPAAFFGLLCIPVLGWLALGIHDLNRKENDETDSAFSWQRYGFPLLAAGFMALSAYQVDHAQDARQYTFLLLIAMLIVSLAVRLVKTAGKGIWRWLALSLLLATGLYTQYFFVTFAGFILAYLTWQGRKEKGFLLKLAATAGLMVILLLPWLPIFKSQMAFFSTVGHYTAGLWNPVRLPEKIWRIFCEFLLPKSGLGKLLPLLVLVSGAAVWFFARRQTGTQEQKQDPISFLSPALGLILAWLALVVGGQVVLDLVKDTQTATIRRYLFLASPAIYLLMAYTLAWMGTMGNRIRWSGYLAVLLSGLTLVLMAVDTGTVLFKKHTSSDEFRQAADWINRNYRPGDLVLVSKSGAMATGMALYLKPETQMLGVDVQQFEELADGSPLMKRLESAVKQRSRVWLVFSHAARSTRFRLGEWLGASGFKPADERKVPGVRVHLLQR